MKTIKTALLSYGASGKLFHAPFLNLHDGYELIGAWERSKKNIVSDYPYTISYNSLEEILSSDAELIIVNTPIDTHFELTKKALEAGKNVVVEKAFTTTAEEAKILHQLTEKKKLKLCVYQNRRYDSDFLTVKKILSEDKLGDIVEAEIRFERFNPNLSPKHWKEDGNPGASILMDLGSHIIDQALVLFGYPEKLFADLRKTRINTKINDYFDILLYYPNKRVRLKSSYFVKEATPAYVLHGKKGSFLKERGDVQENELRLNNKPNRETWGTEPAEKEGLLCYENIREKTKTLQGNYLWFYDELHQAIITDTEVPVTAMQAYKTMSIIEAAIKSSETGEIIAL